MDYLTLLPLDLLGQEIFGFLELQDIITLENAACSYSYQKLLRDMLPYCPPVALHHDISLLSDKGWNLCHKIRCPIEHTKLNLEILNGLQIEDFVLENIELIVLKNTSLQDIYPLHDSNISCRITKLRIIGSQKANVINVLLSYLKNVRCLYLQELEDSNLLMWMDSIKSFSSALKELSISKVSYGYMSIAKQCSLLEKVSLEQASSVELSTIAQYSPQLRSLCIKLLRFDTEAEMLVHMRAFVEKCAVLEELRLVTVNLTDGIAIALSEHCIRLKKLVLSSSRTTPSALVVLSERGLPLEELDVSFIEVPSAELAAQCAHTLSRITQLNTYMFDYRDADLCYELQYITGLREIVFDSWKDHLLVPKLLQCSALRSITVHYCSSITLPQLLNVVSQCAQLRVLHIWLDLCAADELLLQLACSCPHLQELVFINISLKRAITDAGVIALSRRCRQLKVLKLHEQIDVKGGSMRLLLHSCRRLVELELHASMLGCIGLPKEELNKYNCFSYVKCSKAVIQQMRQLPL